VAGGVNTILANLLKFGKRNWLVHQNVLYEPSQGVLA